MKIYKKLYINSKVILGLFLISILLNIYQYTELNKSDQLLLNLHNKLDQQQEEAVQKLEKINKQERSMVYIQISGEVENPGIYEFDMPVKIFELIEKASGITEKASIETINLVETVYDGEKIYIPNKGEETKNSESSGHHVRNKYININNATLEELMSLTGIGQSKAKAIIEYRKTFGKFKLKEDILEVNGIGPAIYDKIESSIKVN